MPKRQPIVPKRQPIVLSGQFPTSAEVARMLGISPPAGKRAGSHDGGILPPGASSSGEEERA